jgi:hypothetical protein
MNFPNKVVSDEKPVNLMRRKNELKMTISLSLQASPPSGFPA